MRNLVWVAAVFAGLSAPVASAESSPRLVRTCDVYSAPMAGTRRVCRKRAGTEVSSIERAATGFLKVLIEDCAGFVPDACLGSDAISSGRPVRRGTASVAAGGYRLGLTAGVDGNLGKVAYSTSLSSGLGYAAALRFDVPLSSNWRLTLSSGYRVLRLSRNLDGSGSITDSNPARFSQTMQSISASAVAGYFVIDEGNTDLLVEVGSEFIKPFSAEQTDAEGTSTTFEASDKMVLALLGLGMDYPLSSSLAILGQLQGFYNLGASSGTGLFGARLALTLSFAL